MEGREEVGREEEVGASEEDAGGMRNAEAAEGGGRRVDEEDGREGREGGGIKEVDGVEMILGDGNVGEERDISGFCRDLGELLDGGGMVLVRAGCCWLLGDLGDEGIGL